MRKSRLFVCLVAIALLLSACAPVTGPDVTTDKSANIHVTDENITKRNTEINRPVPNNTEQLENIATLHEASLFRFLEETNHSGTYLPNKELVPPGTPYEIWQIPKASQTLVGQTVSLILAKVEWAVPFYYSCDEDGTERLAVYLQAEAVPMLMIFETDLGGIHGLYRKIKNEEIFQGKVLAVTNVDDVEGNFQAYGVCRYVDDVRESEIISVETSLTAGECLGVVNSDGTVILKAGQYATASDALREDIEWMHEKFLRYSLDELMT